MKTEIAIHFTKTVINTETQEKETTNGISYMNTASETLARKWFLEDRKPNESYVINRIEKVKN